MKTLPTAIAMLFAVSVYASPQEEAEALRAKGLYQPAIDLLAKEVGKDTVDSSLVVQYARILYEAKQEILSRVVDEFFRGYPFRCMITPPSA